MPARIFHYPKFFSRLRLQLKIAFPPRFLLQKAADKYYNFVQNARSALFDNLDQIPSNARVLQHQHTGKE